MGWCVNGSRRVEEAEAAQDLRALRAADGQPERRAAARPRPAVWGVKRSKGQRVKGSKG